MKISYFFFILFFLDTVLAVQACGPRGNGKRYAAVKTLLMPLLFIGCALLTDRPVFLPLLALVCGWLGDILLIGRDKKIKFMLGMLFFAAGHILYTVACFSLCRNPTVPELSAAGLFFVIYAVFLILGKPRLTRLHGKLSAAATVYGLILAVFGFSAALLCLQNRSIRAGFVLLGAILFIFSDSLLSLQSFRKKTPCGNMFVIGAYAAAQACIAIGLTLLN